MKTISFTDFRKNASTFISEVEYGENLVLLRGGPVAESFLLLVIQYKLRHGNARVPACKLKGAIFRPQYSESVSRNYEIFNGFL